MVSDPVTPSLEQHCIIKFIQKEKVKPAAHNMVKRPYHVQVCMIGATNVPKAIKTGH
jgi:hypothetical protein